MEDPAAVEWDSIHSALKKWRNALNKNAQAESSPTDFSARVDMRTEPSVTTVAEHYRHDPWAVLVSTILSLRTTDQITLETSQRLLERAPGPRELLALRQDTIARLAYPAGFYRTKAANLRKIAAILLDTYNGAVPADMDALLALPGVGRKTANLVLIEAFDKPGICVDVHVHRICNRAGWLCSKTPEETEMTLREILPRKYWKGINALLVLYGQRLCRPLSPFCSQCVITAWCKKNGVTRNR